MKIIENRDERILEAALKLAEKDHFQFITREQVAAEADVSAGTVNNVFGTMAELKRAVLREAVKRGIVKIVAQGLAERHPIAMKAPVELRRKAALTLV